MNTGDLASRTDFVAIDLLAEHGVDCAFIVQFRTFENAGYAAVAQADDGIGEPTDVGHAVRNIEDGDAAGAQPFHNLKQPVCLGARKR